MPYFLQHTRHVRATVEYRTTVQSNFTWHNPRDGRTCSLLSDTPSISCASPQGAVADTEISADRAQSHARPKLQSPVSTDAYDCDTETLPPPEPEPEPSWYVVQIRDTEMKCGV